LDQGRCGGPVDGARRRQAGQPRADGNQYRSGPDKVQVGDLTYVCTAEGWPYLATVIDLFSRQLVGFAFGERMGAQLVVNGLRMA